MFYIDTMHGFQSSPFMYTKISKNLKPKTLNEGEQVGFDNQAGPKGSGGCECHCGLSPPFLN